MASAPLAPARPDYASTWRTVRSVGLLAAFAAFACGSGPEGRAGEGPPADPAGEWRSLAADEYLLSLEERLLDGGHALEFEAVSEGAFEADIAGSLELEEGGGVTVEAAGTFGSDPVSLWLSVLNGRMIGGNANRRFDEPVPPELREAVVIGLTRMGILHNLARLVGGAPPDRAGGGARAWVEAREAEWVTENVETGERGVAFEIWVNDQPSGEATLWLDGDGRLVGRNQVVRFPGGEMVVRERYSMSSERRLEP